MMFFSVLFCLSLAAHEEVLQIFGKLVHISHKPQSNDSNSDIPILLKGIYHKRNRLLMSFGCKNVRKTITVVIV